MQELAQKINRTKPTVTILVNKLVNYGYVYKEKSITDNRVTYIKLTPLGIALKPVFENISKDLNKIIYKGLSDTDAEKLEILLNNISENFTEQ